MQEETKEVEYTVQHIGSSHFKYTLTTDNKVRIKIPDRFIGTVYEQDWINTCKDMTNKLLEVPRECTLRCRPYKNVSKTQPKLPLRKSHKTKGKGYMYIYDVFNDKIEKAEDEINEINENE